MGKRKQYYGIRFPFTRENNDEIFLDLSSDIVEKAKSDMFHVIFTPKGQRYRMPEFGTRLIDCVFGDNTDMSWSDVKDEIRSAVEKYVPSVTINDINVYRQEDDDHAAYAEIKFTVSDGKKSTKVLETKIKI